ncbi:hypothetical protein B0H63DRAFT_507234 [Podospora didyma]|uniref:Ankyrin n=1 Tax=Podospora didyma TaxID=330526 RepID=A0AAE0NY16_9PEZI|nr:hypothetical protein B0H63DRAFT_507234 [Podospora didyma]
MAIPAHHSEAEKDFFRLAGQGTRATNSLLKILDMLEKFMGGPPNENDNIHILMVNMKDAYGWTLLHHAAVFGNAGTYFKMIKLMTDDALKVLPHETVRTWVNAQENSSTRGDTALHIAAREMFPDACAALRHAGASPQKPNKEGRTAEDVLHAVIHRCETVLQAMGGPSPVIHQHRQQPHHQQPHHQQPHHQQPHHQQPHHQQPHHQQPHHQQQQQHTQQQQQARAQRGTTGGFHPDHTSAPGGAVGVIGGMAPVPLPVQRPPPRPTIPQREFTFGTGIPRSPSRM